MNTPFPDGFLWGAATASYQIEGSPLADGAGPSIWHRFTHTPGNVAGGETGDVACDHYRRMPDDVALLADLGLNAYRFSIAWGRVLPDGAGRVNEPGLAFYDRLVDELLEQGVELFPTLYHWDLPAALNDRGGWLNPDTAARFADYAAVVHERLGDRVGQWVTLNEPWVVMNHGYLEGTHAPGHRNRYEAPRVAHHLLRAHSLGADALRENGAEAVGLVVNLEPHQPATDTPEDRAAAARGDAYVNRFFLDPAFGRPYPAELAEMFGDAWPGFDEAPVDAPPDFVGVNYYKRAVCAHGDDGLLRMRPVSQPRSTHTAMGWEVYPDGLRDILLWAHERYGVPLYVTENGAAFYDPPAVAGDPLDDPLRVAYFHDHLGAVAEALAAGADVRGYFAWSLMDNFEWAEGYAKRFGLVHVDYETQERTPKASAHLLGQLARTNGAALSEDADLVSADLPAADVSR